MPSFRLAIMVPASLLLAGLLTASADEPTAEQIQFFETKIRPVLVEQCYECHSAQAVTNAKLKGGLRLDAEPMTLKGGDTGPAVVPFKPTESLLISAINYDEFEMPPSGQLPASVIADFQKWIEMGAPDPRKTVEVARAPKMDLVAGRKHWSFHPLQEVEPPAQSPWSVNSIDRLIEQRHRELGLHGNPVAEPRILIRRAWFDLLGLPPTPEEVEHWSQRLTQDTTGADPINRAAYLEMLDTLLESPHYGERWARYWMDVARFAESHGYEQDYDRPNAYHYRDFLIRAFNQDLPYDEFVQWQIAGDELAPENPLALMATGFLGAGVFPTQLTEVEFESARYDELDDMVATTGVAFLGLSLGCARCHDHKFDPISSQDYYRFAANFTRTIRSEIDLELDPAGNQERRRLYQMQLDSLSGELARYEAEELPARFRKWLANYEADKTELSPWQVLSGTVTSSASTPFTLQEDGSLLAGGSPPAGETITFETTVPFNQAVALRLEALADASLPRGGPGRADNGNLALGDIRVIRLAQDENEADRQIKLTRAAATFQQNENSLSAAASIDDDPVSGWAVDGQIGKDQAAVFWLANDAELESGTPLRIELDFHHPNGKHTVGRLRLSLTSLAEPPVQVGGEGLAPTVREALTRLSQQADPVEADWVTGLDWFKTTVPDWQQRFEAVSALRQKGPEIQMAKVMVCSEGLPHMSHHADGRGFPHFYPETYILRRGDAEQKVEVASPGFVQVLMPADASAEQWKLEPPAPDWRTSFQRAGLAHWMTDLDQGAGALVARVMVNRLWQHHFGRGLVATPNDFGKSGERPTHPELLEWLAADLVQGGWHLKRLHKEIMSSQTYMQSTDFDDERASIDPDNQNWWRRAPQRLEAEAIRDSMLAVSGQLDASMYGPGTLDPNMRRRSIYFFIKRSQLIPMMMLFDWPEHLVSIGQRSTTTIAPQALMFLNSPQGRGFAAALLESLGSDAPQTRLQTLFARCYGRPPSEIEYQLAEQFVDDQVQIYEGEGQADAQRRAWIDLCQTLLSSSEFIYID